MSRFWSALEPFVLFVMAFAMIVYTCRENLFPEKTVSAFAWQEKAVLVIDPGHGGADGGAVSCRGNTESHLNYQVSEKTAAFAMLFGLEVDMTRDEEEIQYPSDCDTIRKQKKWDTHGRADRIEAVPHGVLLSIHQNNYPTEKPSGMQLLTADTPGSSALAAALTESLSGFALRPTAMISQDVYIMNHISCPAVLCECGFLSNPEEEAKLCDSAYQTEIARCLALGAAKYISNQT